MNRRKTTFQDIKRKGCTVIMVCFVAFMMALIIVGNGLEKMGMGLTDLFGG